MGFAIAEYLMKHYKRNMNSAGYRIPVLMDNGFNEQEIYTWLSTECTPGALGVYTEWQAKPRDLFYLLRSDDVEYKGTPERKVPLQRTSTLQRKSML